MTSPFSPGLLVRTMLLFVLLVSAPSAWSQAIINTAVSGLIFPMAAAFHNGVLYIADRGAHTVWRYDPVKPSLTPFAGGGRVAAQTVSGGTLNVTLVPGQAGYSGDGIPTAVLLNSPSGVALDSSGNVYIADTENNIIRKVSNGVMTTVAGTWPIRGSGAFLAGPRGVAVAGSGNLYISDTLNQQVKRLTPAGVLTAVAGVAGAAGSIDGPLRCIEDPECTAARLNAPLGIAARSGVGGDFVHVAEEGGGKIRFIDVGEQVVDSRESGLAAPSSLALDSRGNMYFVETNRHSVTLCGDGCESFAGTGNAGFSGDGDNASDAELHTPVGVALNEDPETGSHLAVYIVDLGNRRIRVVTFNVIP